jgi:hypothetical protein
MEDDGQRRVSMSDMERDRNKCHKLERRYKKDEGKRERERETNV